MLQVSSQEVCSKGCLKCDSSSSCSICDSSNNYVLNSSNECEIQSLSNCRLSVKKDECVLCDSHFFIKEKKCEAVEANNVIKGCLVYSSSSSCSVCSDEYFLDANSCEIITSSLKVNDCLQYSKNGCEVCNEGIPNSSQTECIKTDEIDFNCGFYYQGQFCLQCNDQYSVSYNALDPSSNYERLLIHESLYGKDRVATLSQPKCSASSSSSSNSILLSACKESLTISRACADCDFSTHFFNFVDLKCEQFPEIEQTENIYGIENCISLNLQYQCTMCFEGYFLNHSKKRCFAHESRVENCKVMSQSIDSQCVLCDDEFYLSNNQCQSRSVSVENCEENNFFSDKCNICKDGFSLQNNGTDCLEIPENCESFTLTSSDTLTCDECKSNFYLLSNICEEIPEESQTSGCVEYSKVQDLEQNISYQCLKCDSNFSLTQNKFYLEGNHTPSSFEAPQEIDKPDNYTCVLKSSFPDDLAGCDKFIDNECVVCSSGGMLYTKLNNCEEITSASEKYIEHCSIYSEDKNICVQCDKSYLNEATGKCVTTNSQDCVVYQKSPNLTDNPVCVNCVEGSQLYDGECYDLSESIPDFDNCLAYDSNTNCIFCGEGYINYFNSSQTGTPTKSHKCFDSRVFLSHSLANLILACTSFEIISTSDIKCFGCIKGYELDSNNHCQPCLPQFLKSNMIDAFVYDSGSDKMYCKNDFGPTHQNCLYYSSDSFDKCFIYSKGYVGSMLMTDLDNSSAYEEAPLIKMTFLGTLMAKNWRETRPEKLKQLPYLMSQKKTANSSNSKLLHYVFQNITDFGSDTVLTGVCHLGFTRDFTGLSIVTDDCNSIIKNCDTKSLIFYDEKPGHLISCSRCFGTDRVIYYTLEQMDKSLLPNIDKELSKSYSSSHLPSTFCYPDNLTGKIENCGVYEIKSTNGGADYSIECRSCKPKFKPTFDNDKVTSCDLITFCKSSRIGNICELCNSGYGFETNNSDFKASRQTCSLLTLATQNCLEWNGDSSNSQCSSCRPGFNDVSNLCRKHFLGDCSHFDSEGNCLKCEGIQKIAYITNVIKEVDKGCRPGTYKSLALCKTQYSENICFECFGNSIINSQGRCFSKNKVMNCESYDPISEKCIKCQSTYNLDSDAQICVPVFSYLKLESEIDYLKLQQDNEFKPSDFECIDDVSFNLMYFKFGYQINRNSLMSCGNIGISNCLVLDHNKLSGQNQIECSKCENSFYLKSIDSPKKQCLFFEPIRNCKSQKYDSEMNLVCEECKSGYYLTLQGTCEMRSFSPKCEQYYPNFNKCERCELDYYFDENINSCRLRFNKSIICVKYYDKKDECETYSETYQYIDNRTIELLKNPPSKPIQAQNETENTSLIENFGIAGCVIYESKDVCKLCDSTSYLYNNECLGVANLIDKCKIYSDSNTCSECDSGFLLNQNKCSSVLSLNCLVYEDEYKCRLCSFEYPFLDSNFKCKKNPENPNCKLYYNSNKCEICEDNFYLNSEGNCISVANHVSNCSLYSSEQICIKCSSGFKLETDEDNKISCVEVVGSDPNCKSSTFSKRQCGMCKPGYILINNVCERCDMNVAGCAICDSSNLSICLMCKSGYSMDSSKNCVINEDVRLNYVKISYDI